MLGVLEKSLIVRVRALTTRTKTPVLAIIFGVPLPSVSPHLNPISRELRDVSIRGH
jgi:hypothetical protein